MTSLGSKLSALECHPTKKVNNAEGLTYLSINFATIQHRKSLTKTAEVGCCPSWTYAAQQSMTIFKTVSLINIFTLKAAAEHELLFNKHSSVL
jgi:hypothetical protein